MQALTPAISVLMPVYNAERYIAEAVESILKQTFSDFEFIIINDGSTDCSLEILQRYAGQDSRIRLISRENRGLVKTLNEGLALANAPLIARMDADDVAYPDRFKLQIEFMNSHEEYVAIGAAVELIDQENNAICIFPTKKNHEEIDSLHISYKAPGALITHPTAMLRRIAVERIGGYDEEFIHAEDMDLFLKLAEVGKLANLNDVLLQYRQHLSSIGYTKRQKQLKNIYEAVRQARKRRKMELLTNPNIDGNMLEQDISNVYVRWAWWALGAGNIETARKYAVKSFKNNPFSLETLKLCACVARGY